jgi:hypothetical protein
MLHFTLQGSVSELQIPELTAEAQRLAIVYFRRLLEGVKINMLP